MTEEYGDEEDPVQREGESESNQKAANNANKKSLPTPQAQTTGNKVSYQEESDKQKRRG